jgi:hypothetical protein
MTNIKRLLLSCLNKNYIFAQKQNLLLTKKQDNKPAQSDSF